MKTTDRPTAPCPADQSAPIRRPISLDQLAMSQGVTPEHVGAYMRGTAAFLSAPYRFVAAVVGLASVSQ